MEWASAYLEWLTIPRGIVIGLGAGFVLAAVSAWRGRNDPDDE